MSEAEDGHARARTLVAIGGHEDKSEEMVILREVARRSGRLPIVVATLASRVARELFEDYLRVFEGLGASEVHHLEIDRRDDAYQRENVELLKRAGCVFITGGDQLKITSKLGGTRVGEALRAFQRRGGLVAGTSAGASVLSETMLVSGRSDDPLKVRETLRMAPGLGLVPDVLIDQHFSQRGRIGRLLAAIAYNPRIIGLGIDENTALVIEDDRHVTVLGENAVYVVDGHDVTHSNVYEVGSSHPVSVFDVRLHVLSSGDRFDLALRKPARRESIEDDEG